MAPKSPSDRPVINTLSLYFEVPLESGSYLRTLIGPSSGNAIGAIKKAHTSNYCGCYENHLQFTILNSFHEKLIELCDRRYQGVADSREIAWHSFFCDINDFFEESAKYAKSSAILPDKFYNEKLSRDHSRLRTFKERDGNPSRNSKNLILAYVAARLCKDDPFRDELLEIDKKLFGGSFEEVFGRPFPTTAEDAKEFRSYIEERIRNSTSEDGSKNGSHVGGVQLAPRLRDDSEEATHEDWRAFNVPEHARLERLNPIRKKVFGELNTLSDAAWACLREQFSELEMGQSTHEAAATLAEALVLGKGPDDTPPARKARDAKGFRDALHISIRRLGEAVNPNVNVDSDLAKLANVLMHSATAAVQDQNGHDIERFIGFNTAQWEQIENAWRTKTKEYGQPAYTMQTTAATDIQAELLASAIDGTAAMFHGPHEGAENEMPRGKYMIERSPPVGRDPGGERAVDLILSEISGKLDPLGMFEQLKSLTSERLAGADVDWNDTDLREQLHYLKQADHRRYFVILPALESVSSPAAQQQLHQVAALLRERLPELLVIPFNTSDRKHEGEERFLFLSLKNFCNS